MKMSAALKVAAALGHNISVRHYQQGHDCLLLLNVDGGHCSRICDVEDAETYVTHLVEQWEGARKEKEREEQAARERAEYERFHGFTDNMTPMQRGRAVKVLIRKFRYDDGIMTRAEWIEKMQATGKARVGIDTYRGKKEYNVYFHDKGWEGELSIEITKTEYEYFQFLGRI